EAAAGPSGDVGVAVGADRDGVAEVAGPVAGEVGRVDEAAAVDAQLRHERVLPGAREARVERVGRRGEVAAGRDAGHVRVARVAERDAEAGRLAVGAGE